MIRSEKNKVDDTSKLMYSKDAMQIYDYSTSGGKNLILEYIKDLPDALKAEILDTRQLIREKGIDAFLLLTTRQLYKKLWEIKISQEGTMHGFDTKVKAPTTQRMLKLRTAFMNKMFWNE